MTTEERVKQAGLDWNSAVGRFAGKQELYVKFLKKFTGDETFTLLQDMWRQKDSTGTEHAAHTLKGVCANLGMTELSELFNRVVQAMREENPQAGFEREELIRDCEREYDKICQMVKTLE